MKEKKQVKLYICPKCRSTNVKYTFELKNLFGVIPNMRCMACKLAAPTFPILVVDANKKGHMKKANKKLIKREKKK